MELEGLNCVITGAGRGIGQHIAETFAREGANLALCARSRDEVTAAGRSLAERFGVRVVTHPVDVSSEPEVAGFAGLVEARLGGVDVLVNNAGVYGPVGPLTRVDLVAWVSALNIDLLGVVHCIRVFGPLMEAGGGGRIVNLAGGGIGGPNQPANVSAYTSSKAAVVSLTETLAKELAPAGIRINALAPGAISTSLIDAVIEAGPQRAGADFHAASVRQREGGDPIEKVGPAAVFLASERAGDLTGRLLSAKWDPLDAIAAELEETGDLEPSRYTLRRVDGVLFTEVPRP